MLLGILNRRNNNSDYNNPNNKLYQQRVPAPYHQHHSNIINRQFPISIHIVGHVIGKKGANIKEIKGLSNCEISLTQTDAEEFTCELKGSELQVDYATELINKAIVKANDYERQQNM